MSKERDPAPLSTEMPQSGVDPHPSGGWTSGVEAERVPGSPDESAQPQGTASDEPLVIGQMLSGRYRIEREVGEGGMGVVYLVSDQQVVGETFAVKVLKAALDPQALELLRQEVRQTRKLSHPNIVDVHSVNVDGKRLYVLMEYLEGKPLNTLLDEEFGRGMPFSHAWPIIEDVGAALGYAHDHNVIHSDSKARERPGDHLREDEAARFRHCAGLAGSAAAQALGVARAHSRLRQLRDAQG